MKKITLFIVPIILFCSNVFAQLGTQWHYEEHPSPGYPQYKGHIMMTDVGEVTLNNVKARKLKNIHTDYLGIVKERFANYIRFDNNKMYYYQTDRFYLLFDFDVQKGDTLKLPIPVGNRKVFYPNDTTFSVKIDSITLIKVGNEMLKKYFIARVFNQSGATSGWTIGSSVIEKIGSTSYLIPADMSLWDNDIPGPLTCYTNGSFQYPSTAECSIVLSTNENNTILSKVFSNLVTDVLEIQTKEKLDFKIINLLGEEQNVNVEFQNSKTVVNTSNLKNGIYLLKSNDVNLNNVKIFKQ